VVLTRISTSLVVRDDRILRRLFELAARGLPLAAPLAVGRAAQAAATAPAHTAGAAREDAEPSWQQPVL
jgi:hypothetical protein